MENIAIITLAVALDNEKGYSRFRFLSTLLSQYYNVDLITSSFQHWEKRQRNKENISKLNTPYQIILVDEPGYKKNIDFRRIYSHKVAAKNIIKVLQKKKYDLIYCIIPDNNMAAQVGKYSINHNIKFIVDIEDLWPEAMEMVSFLPEIFNKILFCSYRKSARLAYKYADAFVGTSDEYRDVPKNKYGITNKPAITVYVGCDLDDFDKGVSKFASEIKKPINEFWVTYAGNLGSSYDIETLIKSAQKLWLDGYHNIKIKILGGGPLEKKYKEIANEYKCNVEFLGYTPYQKMAAYLTKSDILINSFVKKAPQSIVTKIGDYLAAGKPMINTLSSPEFQKKVKNDGFGVNIEAENVEVLTKEILKLKGNKKDLIMMGYNARKIAETQFDRKTSYLKIISLIDGLKG